MSICVDNKRKTYYISYQIKMDDGSYKTYNIRNKDWSLSLGKKYMKAIEQEEIEKDSKARKLYIHKNGAITLEQLIDKFIKEQEEIRSIGTSYGKKVKINKYFPMVFDLERDLDYNFKIENIEKYRDLIVSANLKTISKNNLLRYLKEILIFASEREYITYELSNKLQTRLKALTYVNDENEQTEKMKFWTIEEWDKFISSFNRDDKWYYYFKTTYFAGLRIGESIGLKWSDLNQDKCTIYIRRSVENNGKEKMPKNKSSVAPVTLPKEFIKELLEFKVMYCASDDDYMFFANKRTSKTSVRRIMDQHIKISGVSQISPHGLRHSCASRLINAGVSPLIVSKHLRHSSVKETLDTYSHIFPTETEGLVDKIFE